MSALAQSLGYLKRSPHPHLSLSSQGRGSRGVFEIEELVEILRQEKVQSH